MRSMFWSHISGLFPPLIPPTLIEQSGRFVFTTPASRTIASLDMLSDTARGKLAVVNSGFGFPPGDSRVSCERPPAIAYLGTVDFVKMHPCFFDAIDALEDGASPRRDLGRF